MRIQTQKPFDVRFPHLEKGEVRKSFLDHYIQIIEEKLPQILHPNNEKHGTHSYTKYLAMNDSGEFSM